MKNNFHAARQSITLNMKPSWVHVIRFIVITLCRHQCCGKYIKTCAFSQSHGFKNTSPSKLYFFYIHVFRISGMFVSWDSSQFKSSLTLETLYFKNTDKKKVIIKNVTIYTTEIAWAIKTIWTIPSMTTLKASL